MNNVKLPLYIEAKDEKELELFLEVLTFVRVCMDGIGVLVIWLRSICGAIRMTCGLRVSTGPSTDRTKKR